MSNYYPHFADEEMGAHRGHTARKKQSQNSGPEPSLHISAMEAIMWNQATTARVCDQIVTFKKNVLEKNI